MKLKRYGYLCLGLVLMLTSCDFLGIGGDDGENEPEPLPQPELVWQQNNVALRSSPAPVIEDSSVFVTTFFGVARLKLADGEAQWVTELPGVTPSVFGDMLTDENNLYLRLEQSAVAYRKSDGAEVWSVTFEDSLREGTLAGGTSLMDQSDDHIFIGTREKLLIVDKQRGTVERTITPDVPAETISTKRYNVPVAAQSNGDIVYLLSSFQTQGQTTVNGRIAAYSPADGSLLWEQLAPFQLSAIGTFQSPFLQLTNLNDRLFLMTGPAVVAFDAQSGDQVWTSLFFEDRTDINIGGLLIEEGGHLYAVAADQILELEPASGNQLREIPTEGTGTIDRLVIDDENLFYSAGASLRIAIQVTDLQTGENRFRITSEGDFIEGLTPAFSAADSIVVSIGRSSIFGYTLPELEILD